VAPGASGRGVRGDARSRNPQGGCHDPCLAYRRQSPPAPAGTAQSRPAPRNPAFQRDSHGPPPARDRDPARLRRSARQRRDRHRGRDSVTQATAGCV